MTSVEQSVDNVAEETGFSGVVRFDGEGSFAKAYGLAHRGLGAANTVDTRFAIASGTKGLTALTVMSLIDSGVLQRETTARSVLGDDLPLIGDGVTVKHLLAMRSGIGDYYDENVDDAAFVQPIGVDDVPSAELYVKVLGGFPTLSAPDEKFKYNNGGYVVLALIAERASGTPFPELVKQRVTDPAGMRDTAFLRSDEPDARMALGYLEQEGLRTNVHQLPIVGSGDGGSYSTVADFHALWPALFAGRVVAPGSVDEMVRRRSETPAERDGWTRYGMGFWLHETRDAVMLEGFDLGVSFRSVHDRGAGFTHTVVSNTSHGTWPVTRHLDALVRQ
jgi:CubicO group peptidase (beta-lactamase class C family)